MTRALLWFCVAQFAFDVVVFIRLAVLEPL